jgi:ribose 5-phosphate isomerase B
MKPTIVLAADHAGFGLKEYIKRYLGKKGYRLVDKGASSYDKDDDYPDFIIPAAKEVAKNPKTKGIVFGGSGQGEAIAANKIKGVRAALYYGKDLDIVTLSRTHNNANILSLGARFLSKQQAEDAIELWLSTPFDHEARHVRRIKKMDK